MTVALFWIALGALLIAALWFLRLVIETGAAYKAKVLSTLLFTQHRAVNPQSATEVSADSYRILRLFRARIDHEKRLVSTSFLGLRPQTAIWREGFGSTLHADSAMSAPSVSSTRPRVRSEWERTGTPSTLADAVARAFTEPNPARRRRTQAVVVVQGGRIVAEQYAPPFDASSLFPGWSVAKSLVPSLVGILVGEGRLSVSDQALWPTWSATDPRAAITLEDLLRMRSGLRFKEVYTTPVSDVLRMLYRERDMAAFAASRPLAAPPGTAWSYSSGTTNILSAIIKRTVGESSYIDWPHRVLLDRIGMSSAILEADAAGTFVCSSYMLATARDWARFGRFHLQDGVWDGTRILPEGWMAFCTTPTPQSPTANFGAHWWLKLQPDIGGQTASASRIPADAFFAVGHEGQTISVIPSRDLVVVRHGLSIYIDAWNQAEFVTDILDAL